MTDEAFKLLIGYYEKIEQVTCDLYDSLPTLEADRAPAPDEVASIATFYASGEMTLTEMRRCMQGGL